MRMAILTEGNTSPLTAKTAASLIRYRFDDVIALIDSSAVGQSTSLLLDLEHDVPIVTSVAELADFDTLVIGISPPGGHLPTSWRNEILMALRRGAQVWSGLHEWLGDDPEFRAEAQAHGTTIRDLRRDDSRPIARAEGFSNKQLRILTVGQDCCVGKMVVAIETTRGLTSRGRSAQFCATGQTGIAIAGRGAPMDAFPADFVAGAAEQLVLNAPEDAVAVIEGQGGLAHPSFSGVTLSLMHGSAPQGMIYCFEAKRLHAKGLAHVPLQDHATMIARYEDMAALRLPSRVIGLGVNTRLIKDEDEAKRYLSDLSQELSLPATDVLRFGSAVLCDAIAHLEIEPS